MLVVVAHPDDETFGTGSLIAHASHHGVDVTVACATRGEAGEPTPGTVPDGVDLAAVRAGELRAAADALGARRVIVYDWRDSGMEGEPGKGTLAAAPFDEVVSTAAALIDEVCPTIVVTLDGSDGHRDHAVMRDAVLAAVERSERPPRRLYLHCLPRRLMREWVAVLQRQRPDAAHLALGDLGTPDSQITTVIDTTDVRDARDAAIALHASQTPPFAVMPAWLQDEFLCRDALRRIVPAWEGGPVETALFTNPAPPPQ